MARPNRPPRRQGVVYGPVQPADGGSDAGSLVGRVVGMLVVAGAVGLLVVAALAFMRGGMAGPGATSEPTSVAVSSPSTSPRATLRPTVPPATIPATPAVPTTPVESPAGSPPASAGESPPATPFELAVREGPGYVTFGTVEGERLRIADPRTSFEADEEVISSAHLVRPAGSGELRLVIFRFDPATGAEEIARELRVRPRVASAQIFLRRFQPSEALPGPGIYVVRYLRGDEVMSEGYFRVEG